MHRSVCMYIVHLPYSCQSNQSSNHIFINVLSIFWQCNAPLRAIMMCILQKKNKGCNVFSMLASITLSFFLFLRRTGPSTKVSHSLIKQPLVLNSCSKNPKVVFKVSNCVVVLVKFDCFRISTFLLIACLSSAKLIQ